MITRIGSKRRKAHFYLREWREYRHLTQDHLAERMEMSKSQISRVENIRREYTQRFLEAAAYALDCDVPDLFRHPSARSLDGLLQTAAPDVKALLETLLKTGSD